MRKLFEEFPQYEADSEGYLVRITKARGCRPSMIVKGSIRPDGYLQVYRMKPFNLMHQVIAHVFIGKCPEGFEVNHKNGIRSDNNISNLEYVTRSRNISHGFEIGTPESLQKRHAACRRNAHRTKELEIRKKISDTKTTCSVRCIDNGKLFASTNEAGEWCREQGLTDSPHAGQMIRYAFKTGCNSYGLHWEKLNKIGVE